MMTLHNLKDVEALIEAARHGAIKLRLSNQNVSASNIEDAIAKLEPKPIKENMKPTTEKFSDIYTQSESEAMTREWRRTES